MQKARSHTYKICAPTACRRTVSGTISLLCSRCFSPFPHGTCSLSVSQEYLALPDGPGRFSQNSSCSEILRILQEWLRLRVRDFHSLWSVFPNSSTSLASSLSSPTTLTLPKQYQFGLIPVRSPLLGESLLFSSPPGT